MLVSGRVYQKPWVCLSDCLIFQFLVAQQMAAYRIGFCLCHRFSTLPETNSPPETQKGYYLSNHQFSEAIFYFRVHSLEFLNVDTKDGLERVSLFIDFRFPAVN